MKSFSWINKIADKKVKVRVGSYRYSEVRESPNEYLIIISEKDCIEKEDGFMFKIVWHEIFHIILNHMKRFPKNGNWRMWNIACDFEANELLDFQGGFIRARDYSIEEGQSAEEYYKILMKEEENKNKDQNESEQGEQQQGGELTESQDSGVCSSNNSEPSIQKEINITEIIEDYNKNYNRSIEHDKILREVNAADYTVLKNLNRKVKASSIKIDKKFIKMTEEISKQLSKRFEMTKSEYKNDFMKVNNRKSHDDIIVPGRRKMSGGSKVNFSKTPAIFIDISASTWGELNKEFCKIANYLRIKYGAKIIYYNDKLEAIVKGNDPLINFNDNGGTSIDSAVESAIEMGELSKDDMVVVITDGQDDFTYVKENYKNMIFKIEYDNFKNLQINRI